MSRIRSLCQTATRPRCFFQNRSLCPTSRIQCYGHEKPKDAEQEAFREDNGHVDEQKRKKKPTMAQLDEEVRAKLEGRSGGGGEAGLELEGGKAVAMKRSVKENMFRLI